MPKFNNIQNKEHKLSNGKTIWESRSVDVVAVIFTLIKDTIYVLLEKRSDTMMDEPGKWCLPCGYLDFSESGWEAVIREVYEETGIDIRDHGVLLDNDKQPFFVNTDPSENRQNVSLSYCVVLDRQPILNFKNHEVAETKWVPIDYLNKYELAFNHNKRIEMALEKFDDELCNL